MTGDEKQPQLQRPPQPERPTEPERPPQPERPTEPERPPQTPQTEPERREKIFEEPSQPWPRR